MFSCFIFAPAGFSAAIIAINSTMAFCFKFFITYVTYFYHRFSHPFFWVYMKKKLESYRIYLSRFVSFQVFLWLLLLDSNQRPIGYCTTLIFTSIIFYIICSLDFIFTISVDLGRWCKVSTHSFRLARYCLQHYLLRVSPT